tara:strand:- start:89 stop:508 length:420 start_codon:yes stop_codon:yes gene_type:complete
MRVDDWENQLQLQINQIIAYDKFIRGKNDCGTFVINCIEAITNKKVFKKKYKTLSGFKRILKNLKKKDLLDLINQIAKENNFKRIDIEKAQRGDVLYYKDNRDLEGTVGICIGDKTMFNWKEEITIIPNIKCEIAWRIE